jgi:arabinoxylan arabinofuranohydrolase
MNPILPIQHFVPDVEARVWSDGRIYLYGSYDISGGDTYCSYEQHVFSSADMVNWQHHGECFRSTGPNSDVPWAEQPLYAPDCIFLNGRYYLFFCLADATEGVAESSSPAGRFLHAAPVQGADRDAIDPAALVDDDGQVYYFWGQFHLRGARLRPDLKSIDPATLNTAIITEAGHGFHEGACIRKRNGIYYLVYTDISRGRATCLAYATSSAPLGPYVKRGIIIDNTGCDPQSWNNHGSIAQFPVPASSHRSAAAGVEARNDGQWYVFYHRSSQNTRYNRRVCVEPIYFNPDGTIDEVEMTTQGASGPLDARKELQAARACLLSGGLHTAAVGPTPTQPGFSEHLTAIHDGDWAAYKYLDFGAGVRTIEVQAGSLAYGGRISVHLDAPVGPLLAEIEISRTGGWQNWQGFSAPLQSNPTGVHALYLVFHGKPGRLFDLFNVKFK